MIDRAVGLKGTNTFFIIGSAEILPATVTFADNEFTVIFGNPVTYYQSPLELKPEVAITPEGRLALLFTDNDYRLRLVTATVTADRSVTITSSDEVWTHSDVYSVVYVQKDVLALGFATESLTEGDYEIRAVCAEETLEGGNYTVGFRNTTVISGIEKVTFLRMGSWVLFDANNTQVILAYVTADETDGLIIRDLVYNKQAQKLRLGPRMSNKNGGVTDVDTHGVHYLALLMMMNRRFLVSVPCVLHRRCTIRASLTTASPPCRCAICPPRSSSWATVRSSSCRAASRTLWDPPFCVTCSAKSTTTFPRRRWDIASFSSSVSTGASCAPRFVVTRSRSTRRSASSMSTIAPSDS